MICKVCFNYDYFIWIESSFMLNTNNFSWTDNKFTLWFEEINECILINNFKVQKLITHLSAFFLAINVLMIVLSCFLIIDWNNSFDFCKLNFIILIFNWWNCEEFILFNFFPSIFNFSNFDIVRKSIINNSCVLISNHFLLNFFLLVLMFFLFNLYKVFADLKINS